MFLCLTKVDKSAQTRRNLHTHTHTHTHTCNLLLSPKQIGTICFTIFLLIFPAFATNPDIDTATASCNDGVFNSNTGPVNIEINWEPNDIALHWYDGNTELTVPSGSQSCTYDSTLIPPSVSVVPTREGYTFKGWRAKHLPAGYTKLQYIESSGTQYIDTGFIFTGNTVKYELVYNTPNILQNGQTLFGASEGNQNWSGIEYYTSGDNPTNRSALYIGSDIKHAGPNPVDTTLNYSLFINRNNNAYELLKNGNMYTGSFSGVITNNISIALFAHHVQPNEFIQKASYKNYGFKITQDNVLVRNFIPAKRDSDNVVGLWDTVSETFFTNSGSGIFTAGPVVQ